MRSIVLSTTEFLARVRQVRNEMNRLASTLDRLAQLQQRSLRDANPSLRSPEIEQLVSATQLHNTALRDQIRSLAADTSRTAEVSIFHMKKRQVDALNADFKKQLRGYIEAEQAHQQRCREQFARQYLVANPEASDEEVRQAVGVDGDGEGVFAQAVSHTAASPNTGRPTADAWPCSFPQLRTNTAAQASAVLGSVRARHNDLLRIEQSIKELTRLFEDLDILVVQQDAAVASAEQQTSNVVANLAKGNQEVLVAVKHSQRRRKIFWWSALVTVLILIVVVIVILVALHILPPKQQ